MSESHLPDERSIGRRVSRLATRAGVTLDASQNERIVRHLLRVLHADRELHLTSIHDVGAFVERHVGESLEGATMLDSTVEGAMLDLGSGNGYPGLPIAVARPGLRPYLAEASRRKSVFLRSLIESDYPAGTVLDRQIQRGGDLPADVHFSVIVSRAMGNWERVLPRLADRTTEGARLLVWAGSAMEQIAARASWRRFRLIDRRALPGRERSWIWSFKLNRNL